MRTVFPGDDEIIGSPNNGNLLGILELISKMDPFLADHISRSDNGAMVFQVICLQLSMT